MLNELFPTGMSHFVLGGLMIGLGISLIFITTGLVAGASSVFSSSWSFLSKAEYFHQASLKSSRNWRLVFAIASIAGALVMVQLFDVQSVVTEVSGWQLFIGGLIAGFGARYGNGCTSGHGICGIASLSIPSLLAVLTFLFTAIVTAQVMSAVLGGQS